MIDIQDIYNATNGGLDIILSYYPQAQKSVETGKPFCLRNERTPSAYLKQFGNQYKVTDFGDDAQARSAIDIAMLEDGLSFKEALFLLADRYGVSKTINSTVNRPDIKKRPASDTELHGAINFEASAKFSEKELKLFGPKVTGDHLQKLGYQSAKWFSKTKERETTVISSTENYPIFVRVCSTDGEPFYKFYQPLNPEKAFRFFYTGTKPRDYVNGLKELKAQYTAYNERERSVFESQPGNENKAYKEQKLEAVVICSGERDAVNCLSFGYAPIWLNSESAKLDKTTYSELKKLCEKICNIPDIDATGIKKGIELGMTYLDVHTAKLPQWLTAYKDLRGNPRKDLRDFIELRPYRHEFENLIKTARPYRFWEYVPNNKGFLNLEINTEYMLNFLSDSGFGKLQDPKTKKETFVKVDNNIVREITSKDVRAYLIGFVRQKASDIKVWNLVLNSSRTKTVTMDDLPIINIDFSDNEYDKQFLFFANKTLEVKGTEIVEHRPQDVSRYVWENDVSKHRFKRTGKAFDITYDDNTDTYMIDILNKQSHYFRYLINSSRLFWRAELEERTTGIEEKDLEYINNNKFTIGGKRLSYEEVEEQIQNLVAKIFAIGYLMHRYKALSKTWALWVMEDKVSDDGVSSGGSGKSFMIKFLSNFKQTVTLGGRNKRLTENQHIFEKVTKQTSFLLVDDAEQYIDFNFFYDSITGNMDINQKHVISSTLDYEDSPKLIFTSNFSPRSTDSSTTRRLLYVVFSDWYHEANEDNDYKESRRIIDDFGYEICRGDSYKEEYWNEDINFLVDCLNFYLSTVNNNVKIQPPLNRVQERVNIAAMGNQFKEWAEVYFSEQGDNLNREISKTDVLDDFIRDTNIKNWSTKQFSKALKAFCKNTKHIEELNPKEVCNSGKRIVRKINNKTTEMLYLKTIGTELETDAPF